VLNVLEVGLGGELVVPDLAAYRLGDLLLAMQMRAAATTGGYFNLAKRRSAAARSCTRPW
jgi:hypothetical protein